MSVHDDRTPEQRAEFKKIIEQASLAFPGWRRELLPDQRAIDPPDVVALHVLGSRARGTARPDSDLDLAFELDEWRESQLTMLVTNNARWRSELECLTGLKVQDLYLRSDDEVSCETDEVYRREHP